MSEVKTQEQIDQEIRNLESQLEFYRQTEPGNVDKHNELANQISELKFQLEQQDRVQVQEEKVQSIELPHNLNEVFDDPRANDIVIEIIQMDRRQSYEEHNGEIEQLHQLYREQLRAGNQREIELQQQIEELHSRNKETHQHLHEALDRNAQLEIEKMDAEQKRDNAVKQLEDAQGETARLNAHIDDLLKEAAVGARNAYKVIDSSNRLDELVNQSKQAKIKSAAELALEMAAPFRGTIKLPEVNTPQVTESPFRLDPQVEPQSGGFPAPEADAPVGGAQFPVVTPPSVPAIISGSAVVEGLHTVQKTVEERVAEIEAFVGKLELNIDGSVTWSADEKEQVA